MATTSESRPDRGFRRAMLCGLGGFLACLLVWGATSGGMPPPESEGRLLFSCLAPALVTGLIVKGRRWSWARVAAVYVITTVALVVVAVLPGLKKTGI
jgi:hypothetical protein